MGHGLSTVVYHNVLRWLLHTSQASSPLSSMGAGGEGILASSIQSCTWHSYCVMCTED